MDLQRESMSCTICQAMQCVNESHPAQRGLRRKSLRLHASACVSHQRHLHAAVHAPWHSHWHERPQASRCFELGCHQHEVAQLLAHHQCLHLKQLPVHLMQKVSLQGGWCASCWIHQGLLGRQNHERAYLVGLRWCSGWLQGPRASKCDVGCLQSLPGGLPWGGGAHVHAHAACSIHWQSEPLRPA